LQSSINRFLARVRSILNEVVLFSARKSQGLVPKITVDTLYLHPSETEFFPRLRRARDVCQSTIKSVFIMLAAAILHTKANRNSLNVSWNLLCQADFFVWPVALSKHQQ